LADPAEDGAIGEGVEAIGVQEDRLHRPVGRPEIEQAGGSGASAREGELDSPWIAGRNGGRRRRGRPGQAQCFWVSPWPVAS
jgi:hypothetical protein